MSLTPNIPSTPNSLSLDSTRMPKLKMFHLRLPEILMTNKCNSSCTNQPSLDKLVPISRSSINSHKLNIST